jgi:hypothetical protein
MLYSVTRLLERFISWILLNYFNFTFSSQALKDAAIKNKIYLIGGSIPERDKNKVTAVTV